MSNRERLRRQDPKRSEPIRNLTMYFRDTGAWGNTGPEGEVTDAGLGEAVDDTLTRGVQLGYKIIDEHILQGHRSAQRLRASHAQPEEPARSVEKLVERALDLTKDVGALWLDALEMIVHAPAALAGRGDSEGRSHAETGAAGGTPVAVEIASSRRVQVNLRLTGKIGSPLPRVHALYAADPALPPLAGIALRPSPETGEPILQVEIPDPQPPALYTGVVVDARSNEPVGTLSIRVQG
jgi:hypothetical protein